MKNRQTDQNLSADKAERERFLYHVCKDFLKTLTAKSLRHLIHSPKTRRKAAMTENGSPLPRFSTDEARTYFLVELPVHPQMPGVQAHEKAHEGAHGEAHQELMETEASIVSFVSSQPRSRPAIAEHLGLKSRSGHLYKSIDHLRNMGFIELTIPDKTQSRNQKMRITEKGQVWLAGRPR